MIIEETTFHETASAIEDAIAGKLFGKPCYKLGKKAFCCFYQKCMVFKLTGDAHSNALSLDGATLFDPSKKGRPMKDWVQVPYGYAAQWPTFAQAAADYVGWKLS